jgi:hypothetical protein
MDGWGSFLTQQLAYAAPALIVYLVGMVLAVIFIRKYPGPAILTLLATIILLVTTIGIAMAQVHFMRLRVEPGWTTARYGQVMSVVSIAGSMLRALGLALLLAAVFVGRKSKAISQT